MVLLLIAIGAGIIGALFGLGGGIVFIPVLTILFQQDATTAAAASLVGIVATSTGSATGYVKKGLSNIRLGMLMEITTTIGAITGAIIAGYLENWILLIIFSMVMLYSGFKMAISPEKNITECDAKGDLVFRYSDAASGVEDQPYAVKNCKSGMVLCTIAGAVSSMTGVGGGSIKVPLMNIHMNIPVKVASATSSYMIGITAFSGAIIYFIQGAISYQIATAVAIGAYIGAVIGTRISAKVNAKAIKRYMSVVFFFIAATMLLKAGGYM
ncbi:MAG: sulfite exporter TauE/SafE family protein [archaeon]|nr:sulfite exporter TauE/SafE family protein [archaeon]